MENEGRFVELTRVFDPIEADLLAAFLEDGEVEFEMVNRESARVMASLLSPMQNPVIFHVREEDLEQAALLLQEYRSMQAAAPPSSLFPQSADSEPAEGDAPPDPDDERK